MNSKELVYETLNFTNSSNRAPRMLWQLPWATMNYKKELDKIKNDFPDDIVNITPAYHSSSVSKGDAYEIGTYIDDWGTEFINIHRGVIGEVKNPLIKNDDYSDSDKINFPLQWLDFNINEVNSLVSNFKDKFTIFNVFPRPFEQLQFLRGTENLYMDLMFMETGFVKFANKLHDFYCALLEKQAKTNVDALFMMDDWGSQNTLLINPKIWVDFFKPKYKDYIDIAHKYNKKMFMHSDGNILHIIPHLIDLKLDAINSQLFCMKLENLEKYKGKITFWGEIDRQHILPFGDVLDVKNAVNNVKQSLWQNGGCIAQCEFGPGAKPENVYTVFDEWNKI